MNKVRLFDASALSVASRILLDGKLVVVPTETVYGLAACATNPDAIAAIYRAKNRPSSNPLIAHVDGLSMAQEFGVFGETELKLAAEFWPGPLTIVVPKTEKVLESVSAGASTVAIRSPESELLRKLIEMVGSPLAAPSANVFTELSPTRVEMLSPLIVEAAELILDGGKCQIGIESTVVRVAGGRIEILRAGHIDASQLEQRMKLPVVKIEHAGNASPGQHRRHYSPTTPIELVKEIGEHPGIGFGNPTVDQIQMPNDPHQYAQKLYATLSELDRGGYARIYVEMPPRTPEWEAVWDRLTRAAYESD